MSAFKVCSNRTKRRRVAAAVTEFITELENDNLIVSDPSSSALKIDFVSQYAKLVAY